MTQNKKQKAFARLVQKADGIPYVAALNRVRERLAELIGGGLSRSDAVARLEADYGVTGKGHQA